MQVTKIDGKKNPADLGTKALDAAAIERHCQRMGVEAKEGRHMLAPK